MNYETITTDIRNDFTYIILNRPERLNSFDIKLGEELYNALRKSAINDRIRGVVIRGTGKGFHNARSILLTCPRRLSPWLDSGQYNHDAIQYRADFL